MKLDTLIEHPGGCGSNLVYNLSRLGRRTALHAFVGDTDCATLLEQLAHPAADIQGVNRLPKAKTARAFIFTDSKGDQFTAFKPMAVATADYRRTLQETLDRVQPGMTITAKVNTRKSSR